MSPVQVALRGSGRYLSPIQFEQEATETHRTNRPHSTRSFVCFHGVRENTQNSASVWEKTVRTGTVFFDGGVVVMVVMG